MGHSCCRGTRRVLVQVLIFAWEREHKPGSFGDEGQVPLLARRQSLLRLEAASPGAEPSGSRAVRVA